MEKDLQTKGVPTVTFFVPCKNEEANIEPTLDNIAAACAEVGITYEALIIDDASTDRTVEVVEAYRAKHPDVCITLKKNPKTMGLGSNYVEGAFLGQGEYYMLVNGDNAEPRSAIVAILSQLGKADMIIPFFGKGNDARRLRRRAVSATFTFLVNAASGNSVRYFNGPVLHKRYNVMRWHPNSHGFAYQAELITRLLQEGKTYREVQIRNLDRHTGLSKAFALQNVLSVVHSILQIFVGRLRRTIFR